MNAWARGSAVLLAVWVVSTGAIGCAAPPDAVTNPDYEAWVHYAPGTSVRFEGVQTVGEDSQTIVISEKLLSKDAERVILERTMERLDNGSEDRTSLWVERATIAPVDHPLTHPNAIVKPQEDEAIGIGEEVFTCDVVELKLEESIEGFFDAAEEVNGRLWEHGDVPGGLGKVNLQAVGEPDRYRLEGQVVSFEIAE